MFTGLVNGQGRVVNLSKERSGARLEIQVPPAYRRLPIGASVSVDGCCLTITKRSRKKLCFDLVRETLKRTRFSSLSPGDKLNLEKPLRWKGSLDGHLVQGHVDDVARLKKIEKKGRSISFQLKAPKRLAKFLISKGSVALNGVSLTISQSDRIGLFWVNLIPRTLKKTNLGRLLPGAVLNLEADLLLKSRR